MNRFIAVEGSETAHCCFNASVIDRASPMIGGSDKPMQDKFSVVCECFDMEDAVKIADLLNRDSLLPTEEEIALMIYDRAPAWGDLPEVGIHSAPNPYRPGHNIDTPGKSHWLAIARDVRASLQSQV
jgi:hypothetical protein